MKPLEAGVQGAATVAEQKPAEDNQRRAVHSTESTRSCGLSLSMVGEAAETL